MNLATSTNGLAKTRIGLNPFPIICLIIFIPTNLIVDEYFRTYYYKILYQFPLVSVTCRIIDDKYQNLISTNHATHHARCYALNPYTIFSNN